MTDTVHPENGLPDITLARAEFLEKLAVSQVFTFTLFPGHDQSSQLPNQYVGQDKSSQKQGTNYDICEQHHIPSMFRRVPL